jgi:hypothetical protein
VWGPTRQAVHDVECGDFLGGAANLGLAVSDVVLVGELYRGIRAGAFFPGHTFTRGAKAGTTTFESKQALKWYRDARGIVGRDVEVHHWLIENNSPIGKLVPDIIKNQPWNFHPMDTILHQGGMHGNRPNVLPEFGLGGKLWHGTPRWAKALVGGYGGRLATIDGCGCEE